MPVVRSCSDEGMEKKALTTGHTMLVSGPALVVLENGEATVLSAPLDGGEKIVVRGERQLAFEAKSDCIFQTSLGEEAKCVEILGSTIPPSWKEAAQAILQIENPRVIIIGHVDSGKTVLCTYLTNTLLSEHSTVAVLDADLGQADIGPPAVLSLAITDECVLSLSDLDPAAMFFVGHTSPAPDKSRVIEGLQRLLKNNPCDNTPLIVNTDGWIGEKEADVFKATMISSLAPDVVVAIERQEGELGNVLSLTKARSIVVRTSSAARVRSREERRRLRELNFRRFLEGGIMRHVDFRKTLPRGVQLREGRLRKTKDKTNSLVGFLNERELLLGIGILKAVAQREGFMKIFTAFTNEPSILEFGSVKIDERGRELSANEHQISALS